MIQFKAIMHRFGEMGEKTGWVYIDIPSNQAKKLHSKDHKSFRVKGKLDEMSLQQVALIPMGEGDYILPINATMRKKLKKEEGASLQVELHLDDSTMEINEDLIACLKDDNEAWRYFSSLAPGHQRYYSKWVSDAKTIQTKADRIHKCLYAMQHGMDYGTMIRHFKKQSL